MQTYFLFENYVWHCCKVLQFYFSNEKRSGPFFLSRKVLLVIWINSRSLESNNEQPTLFLVPHLLNGIALLSNIQVYSPVYGDANPEFSFDPTLKACIMYSNDPGHKRIPISVFIYTFLLLTMRDIRTVAQYPQMILQTLQRVSISNVPSMSQQYVGAGRKYAVRLRCLGIM